MLSMGKAKIKKVRVKKQSETSEEDLSVEVNCCVPSGEILLEKRLSVLTVIVVEDFSVSSLML